MNRLDLSVNIAPHLAKDLLLSNPVMTASGTFGYGTEFYDLVDVQQLGAIVSKGTTLKPRDGNPQPRLIETSCGVINSIGLQNIGIEALIKEKAPVWSRWSVPVVVNIAGNTIEEYGEIAAKLEGVAGIRGIEVNISCPNVAAGGLEFGTCSRTANQVTAAVRSRTTLPVIVKLSPNVTDIVEIAMAVADAGADAISAINTVRAMGVEIELRKLVPGAGSGGLSGPAIKPIALYNVYRISKAVRIPVLGCGGITSASDAIEFLMAGATAVQVGTANLVNPQSPLDVLRGIVVFMEKHGVRRVTELIGVAEPFGN